jgi:hypothetical protein
VLDGVPIQHFLQDAFLDMWETVVRAVGDLDSVLGFAVRPPYIPLIGHFDLGHATGEYVKMMNEPHRGYIDLPSLHELDYNTDLHLGGVRAYCHTLPLFELVSVADNLTWSQPPHSNLSSSARVTRPV